MGVWTAVGSCLPNVVEFELSECLKLAEFSEPLPESFSDEPLEVVEDTLLFPGMTMLSDSTSWVEYGLRVMWGRRVLIPFSVWAWAIRGLFTCCPAAAIWWLWWWTIWLWWRVAAR